MDVFVPLAMRPALTGDSLDERGDRGLMLIGRLLPGVGIEDARSELALVARRLHSSYPDVWANRLAEPRSVSVLPEAASRVLPQIRGPVSGFLGVLFAAVGLVLLIACSNVANLLLARASVRRRETAVRIALGASRGQLVRQFLAESLLLSCGAGALGVALAALSLRLILAFQPPLPVSLALGLELDLRVLLFALLLSMATGVVFGLWPALRASSASPIESLTARGPESPGRRRFAARDALVVAQVAGSLVLLIGAGLFLRSLANAKALDPGFDPNGMLVLSIDLGPSGYDEARGARFDEIDLEARLWTLPAARMKGGKLHRVPLSPRAVAIVKEMAAIRLNDFVFPSIKRDKPLSDTALLLLLRDLHPGITTHGFRSTFKGLGGRDDGLFGFPV
jgi:hypothetical protein